MTPGAYEPIIDEKTFQQAHQILQSRTINKSNQELLDSLHALWRSKGRLSLRIIQNSATVPSASVYRQRFGSLRKAYELVGYGKPADFGPIDLRRRTQALREKLMLEIQRLFPDKILIVRKGGRWRSRLRLGKNGRFISVLVCRCVQTREGHTRWCVDLPRQERRFPVLLARLNRKNTGILDVHVLPELKRQGRFQLSLHDPCLKAGRKLSTLNAFWAALASVGWFIKLRSCDSGKA